ncbi:uncharacterized protein LOC135928628 [Gordionus sp. m RMFG-2023]|uniref:uncharacterized protein LOC135928628 n=1 Tax=Gordionus sp. m RMFG-2023 TaxID=3053472 RepID=UPI0031FC87B7
MMHLYASSAALGKAFQSYCPPSNRGMYSAYTTPVYGRAVRRTSSINLVFMWSSLNYPDKLANFKPNHFCYLQSLPSSPPPIIGHLSPRIDVAPFIFPLIENNSQHIFPPPIEYPPIISYLPTILSDDGLLFDSPISVDNDSPPISPSIKSLSSMSHLSHISSSANNPPHIFQPLINSPSSIAFLSPVLMPAILNDSLFIFPSSVNNNSPTITNLSSIVSSSLPFLDTDIIINMLLNPINILESIPTGIKNNVIFTISNKENMVLKERGKKLVYSDDCGAWTGTSTGTTKYYYSININDNTISSGPMVIKDGLFGKSTTKRYNHIFIAAKPQPNPQDLVILNRYYTKLKNCETYKRRICHLDKHLNSSVHLIQSIFIVEYIGTYPGLFPHGNNRNYSGVYSRTPVCIMRQIKEKVVHQPPKDVYQDLIANEENYFTPRDIKQIRNIQFNELHKNDSCYLKNFSDQINELLKNIHKYPILKKIDISPDRVCSLILYTSLMLDNIKYICSQDFPSIIGVDKTYNLGPLFVTTTVFKNQVLMSKYSQDHPIFFGPIFLHGSSDYETFNIFFSHLEGVFKKNKINVENLIFGSDEELGLITSLRKNFSNSTHILCTYHMKKNLNLFLQDKEGMDSRTREDIVTKIFGKEGLVFSLSDKIFGEKVEKLRDYCRDKQFIKLLKHIDASLKNNLFLYVYLPLKNKVISYLYTNNNCESLNNVLKIKFNRDSTTPVHMMVNKIYELSLAQEKDFERALLGLGNYYLTKKYDVTKIRHEWDQISDDQRKKIILNVLKSHSTNKRKKITSTCGGLTLIQPTGSKKPCQSKRSRSDRTRG